MRTHRSSVFAPILVLAVFGIAMLNYAPRSEAQTGVSVTINPKEALLYPGGVQQFTAKVTGTNRTSIVWMVNDISGGSSSLGKIDGKGRYTAPSAPPAGYSVTIKASLSANPAISASAAVTIRYPAPTLSSVTPNTIPLDAFTLNVSGKGFYNGAQVLWNGAALKTDYVSATGLVARGQAAAPGTAMISVANPGPGSVSNSIPVSVTAPVTVSVTPNTATVPTGSTQQFHAVVYNASNQEVVWKVNGVAGGTATAGAITSAGLYTAPWAAPATGITVSATSAADASATGTAVVTVVEESRIRYTRLVDQSSFGLTPELLARAQQLGIAGYVEEQLSLPESPGPGQSPTNAQVVYSFFNNALRGEDQLRQRVIYALSQIFVVSRNKNNYGNELAPWLQILSRNAFGNFRTLLREITVDASMGKYLDLVNSGVYGGAPNENFPREVMQLFTIGLWKLNADGSLQLDASSQPMPAYSQYDVEQLARALTGWTYGNSTGTPPTGGNWNYYPGPMLPVESRRNTSEKTILGRTIPANQTAAQDLDRAIDILFEHPNVAPFISVRLIRALVTSNPSPGYVARISAVFNNNGAGVRGDMRSVIRAILLDAEARNDNPPSDFGRLRSPLQQTTAMMRALGFTIPPQTDPNQWINFSWIFDMHLDEGLLNAPSVFGHYSPMFRIPGGSLYGPEFQIYSATTAINRANFLYGFWGSPWPINPVLQPYLAIAANHAGLVDAVDAALLHGRMPATTRTAILEALPQMPDNYQRVFTALYLTVTSGEFLVQR
ncbi:MAG: DUF1800 family protein [Acidobacteria bacterium]|nr:DUF1800 family protein [Acidobacteriota bacterium]